MVRRGVLSAFDTTTMGLHQVMGVPMGTGLIMSLSTSLSKLALTGVLK